MDAKAALRSLLAIVGGMLFITISVEALEWTLVTAINRAPITDPEAYFAVRNGTGFLLVKVIYNTAAAVAGGYLAARIAGRAEILHGLAVAGIQTGSFVWAVFQPEMRRWTPMWMWIVLIFVSAVGIIYGARLAGEKRLRHEGS